MSTPSLNNLGSYVQSLFGNALQGVGATTNTTTNQSNGISPSPFQLDHTGLSPFAQLLNQLQQLQQSDPAKYAQVTQQIATNLQSAAQTDTADGNTTAANQLNQLSADFTSASKSGQLPNIQDLAQAIGGGHHHHHHAHAAPPSGGTDSDGDAGDGSSSNSSSSSASTSSTSASNSDPLVSQFLAALNSSSGQTNPQNPLNIILNTLSSAGINAGTANS